MREPLTAMTHSKAQLAEVATRRTALIRLRRAGVPSEDERILPLGCAPAATTPPRTSSAPSPSAATTNNV